MKYLLVLLVVLAGAWMMLRRRGKPAPPPPDQQAPAPGRPAEPGPPAGAQRMVACSHCGVHLPQAEASSDPAGRRYCSEAHQLAGPR